MGFKHPLAALALIIVLLPPLPAAAASIVAFGDSLMAGYRLGPGESYPERLEEALAGKGHDVVIANAGVSGDTTSGGLARLDWSVPEGTDIVILGLGANDMLRGVSPELTKANLRAMIERLAEREIDIMLVGMLAAPNLGQDYREAFDAVYPTLAEEYGLSLLPFFLDGVATRPDLLLDDGMHPNAAGVEIMVENSLPLIEELLQAQR